MKLKLVVASMSLVGLIGSQAHAATQTSTTTKQTHSHKVMHQQDAAPLYKGERIYKGEEIAPVLNDWYHRIAIDGGVNFDAKWGNRRMGYEGENNQRLSVNDVHLNVTATVNDWVKAFASLSYDNTSRQLTGSNGGPNPLATTNAPKPGVYDNIKDNIGGVVLEQGYIKFANLTEMPLYLTVGKQFVDFGKYNLHPITQPLTQVISETLRNAATIGFNTMAMGPVGIFGSAYVFDSPYKQQMPAVIAAGGTVPGTPIPATSLTPAVTGSSQGHGKPIYGLRLGIGQENDAFTWDLSADYLYNMIGVEGVAYGVGIFNGSNTAANVGNNGVATGGTYKNRVGGFAINGDLKTGPFDVELRYVTALQTFSPFDLTKNVVATTAITGATGAKPWAAGINAGYAFTAWEKGQDVFLGYQRSQNSVNLYLPQSRWVAGYGMDVMKNTNVAIELDHDIDYSISNGGTGTNNNQIGLRVGVRFG